MEIQRIKQSIEEGKSCLVNRTMMYLYPSMEFYGEEFIQRVKDLGFFFVGLDQQEEECLNLLFFVKNCKNKKVLELLEWFKSHFAFKEEYIYGDLVFDWFHVITIRLPRKYWKSKTLFLEGKYSKMYNSTEVNNIFVNQDPRFTDPELKSLTLGVIKKSETRRRQLQSYINKGVKSEKDFIYLDYSNEFDSIPELEEEYL